MDSVALAEAQDVDQSLSWIAATEGIVWVAKQQARDLLAACFCFEDGLLVCIDACKGIGFSEVDRDDLCACTETWVHVEPCVIWPAEEEAFARIGQRPRQLFQRGATAIGHDNMIRFKRYLMIQVSIE